MRRNAQADDGEPDPDPSGGTTASHPRMPLVHLLRSVAVDLDLRAAAFAAEQHLHPTDLRALIALLDAERAGESMAPGRLGARLHLNSPTTTAVIDRLEALGFLTRERDPHDRRRVLLVVSREAKILGWDFFGPLITRILAVMDGFEPADLDAYERVLRAIAQSLHAN
ncbi:MarR family winged helix-turn-helix transcriptional regulator [Actinospica sp.]|jgi:DNA-binding MarR family transcriptional regulator|uniref:MarR family winged helix-turn-helix transcriptional regulator n=1 Tax=Actinospica sp. TaxID=1872142 RepID=UPI002CEA85E2|nr:MarR family transcriptional regulator [Actinospica sp.]HWG28473.1 MarR family transcriptional regulator [Actinospica sp.]